MLKDFPRKIGYDDPLEIYLSRLESLLLSDYKISKRSVSLLLLQEDIEITDIVKEKEGLRAAEDPKYHTGSKGALFPAAYLYCEPAPPEGGKPYL